MPGSDPLGWVGAMLGHDFIRHALLAGTFVALSAGLVGYFVVVRNQVFAAESLGHFAFTGALAALALGLDPRAGLFAVVLAGALALGSLGGRPGSREVVVGTAFAWVLGLGVLCLSIYTTSRSSANGAAGVSILFGSIYGLTSAQATLAALIGAACVAVVLVVARPLLFASIDPDVAAARGLPVRTLGLVFLAVLGVAVSEAVQAVGALLLVSLLVTPAAIAHRLVARPFAALAISALLSVIFVWVGLTLSYAIQRLPPSVAIVSFAFAAYVVAMVASGLRGVRGRRRSAGDPG